MSTDKRPDRLPSRGQVLELIEFVKDHSLYYAELWSCCKDVTDLSDLPVSDHAAYWGANTCVDSQVVTSKQKDGIIFKTGGTTANPKVSFYSHAEFRRVNEHLAESLARCGVGAGDRVANLFYAGDLYGSFLLHVLSVYHLPDGAIQVPIAGHVSVESMLQHIAEFETSVVLGTVTTMFKIAELLVQAGDTAPYVRLLLFSGEAFYEDQAALLHAAFPAASVRSVVYGSMDCGIIGLPPRHGDFNGDHRLHEATQGNIIEIVNEDGEVTTKAGEAGSLMFTNLERRLMPVIRYPSGDRAAWIDYESGFFRVLDRDRTAIRIGPVSIDFVDLRRIVKAALQGRALSGVQAVVSREDSKDLLTLVVAQHEPVSGDEAAGLRAAIAEGLAAERPMFQAEVDKGVVKPLRVKFGAVGGLAVNPRSGKIMEIMDLRSTD